MENYEDIMRKGNISRNMDNYPQALKEINPENMGKTMAYRLIYPEIYYKLQPYIMMVCDQMDVYNTVPTQEMVESMTDAIYDDVVRMFPDIAEYVREHENNEVRETIQNCSVEEEGNTSQRDRLSPVSLILFSTCMIHNIFTVI